MSKQIVLNVLLQLILMRKTGFGATTTESTGTIRLAGGGSNWGRVEVFHDGEWGTVCDDNADSHFANVLCKELGMSYGTILYPGDFAEGSGQIWLDDVTCTGIESSIVNCRHIGWGVNNCGHPEDVGVVCGGADCGLPPTIDNGHIITSGVTVYGSSAEVVCNPGYSAFRNASNGVIRCLPSGQWQTITCEPINCGLPPTIVSGYITLLDEQNTTYGARADVLCNPGYDPTTSLIMCGPNGEWDNASCSPRDCGMPTLLHYDSIVWFSSTYGAAANVTCKVGYVLTGGLLICTSNGTWTGAQCVAVDCGNPLPLINGHTSLLQHENTTFGALATVVCSPGYTSNISEVMCLANAQWRNASCELIDCGPIPYLSNGNVTLLQLGNTTYGAVAEVSCIEGYVSVNNEIACMSNGTWSAASCNVVDCGLPPTVLSGSITLLDPLNTTCGALAVVNCTIGYEHSKPLIKCGLNGEWENAFCEPHDCGPVISLPNGVVKTPDGTTFGKTAMYSCIPGYKLIGLSVMSCLASGWPLVAIECIIKDCYPLKNPIKGLVVMPKGSTYQAVARYTCNQGYELIGDEKRICQSTGTWSGIQPTCHLKGQPKVVCPTNVDSRGTEWKEVIQGTTRVQQCAEGFEGKVTRKCLDDGTWQLPQYNCVRKTVTNVAENVDTLANNATADTISNALKQIANVTGNEEKTNTSELLTDAEITVLASSLDIVADIVVNKSLPTQDVVKAFLQSVSNLVDERNKESWETLKQTKSTGGENMLASVDKIGVALREKVEAGEAGFTNFTIVQKNVALEVNKIKKQDIVFPYADIKTDQQDDQNWAKTSESSIRLDAKAMGDNEVTVTVVIYKDMSHVLPNTSDTNAGIKKKDQTLKGPILSLSLSNHLGKLDPPVSLTFERMQANLTSPVCSYWKYGSKQETGYWASDGCKLQMSEDTKTVCECDHLTNFAVLMSPFVKADATSMPLRTVSTVGIGISMACLLATMLTYIYLWRFLKSDRTILLLNLCGALLLSYIIFLAGVDKTENKALCATTAAFLHYIYLVVFCLMLAEGIDIAIMVVYVFITKSRLKPLLISAWVAPAVVVGISLLSTQADGYGNENFCWLSLTRGLIWAFVAPALVIILFNIVCLALVMRNMFHMKAMDNKTSTEKIKTSLRSLCVLVPLMGVSWILGIFYVNESASFMQYLFALFNTLQGLFIFIFNCIFNQQVRTAVKNVYKKRENLKSIERSTSRKTSKNNKSFKSSFNTHSENVSTTNHNEVFEENSEAPQKHVYSRLRDRILSKKATLTGKKCEDPIPLSRKSSVGFANVVLRAVRFTDRYSLLGRSDSAKSRSKTVTTAIDSDLN